MFFRTLYRSHFLIFVGKIAVVRSFAGRKYSYHLIVYGVPIYTYCSSNGPSSPEWRAKKVQFHLYQHSYLTCYFSLEHIRFLCMHIYDNTPCFLPGKNLYNLLSSVSLKRLAMQAVGETNKAYYGRCTNFNRIICTTRPSRKLRMTWYLSLKPRANGRIIVAQKHVASVCTPCCMLIACCWRCCVKFETGQSFSYGKVKETQQLPPLLGQQCWELLNTFASGFSPKLSSDIVDVMKIYRDTRK